MTSTTVGREAARFNPLMQLRPPDTTPEQTVLIDTIMSAVGSYLFFGLDCAEITAQDFAAASRYLFESGPRLVGAERPTFDSQYQDSGLMQFLPKSHFQAWLKHEREQIVRENNL